MPDLVQPNALQARSQALGKRQGEDDEPIDYAGDQHPSWLKPTLATLEHLTLYSTLYIGFFPKCDLRPLHFPRLKTLALGNHTFCHDSQPQWILSHADTLTELYLDDCSIMWEAAVYNEAASDENTSERTLLPRDAFKPHPHLPNRKLYYAYASRWADYFNVFKDKTPAAQALPAEERIKIGFHDESYLVFYDGILPSEHTQHIYWKVPREGGAAEDVHGKVLEPSEEDRRALVELLKKLGQECPLEKD
ncbi:uncharacterized protein BDV17DRAFT_288188 [Aspergillus undulatus]|uniref:uncharacterized protein n=1 Tax=Aspergillus undulatus TaxID=1810928 RepID=UPI003CCCFA9F